jgi:outer membrane protein OmpA-like peptidoglycan-associated protein
MGGYGGSDIYVVHLLDNDRWSEPENLGPTINTTGDEQCPFIHADNQTLYFSSSYWQGYGDEDIFLSRKNLLTGKWSIPENLGYPINTIDREGTLFVTADGKTAYYASERTDSYGGLDLYSFELRPDIRPINTRWVKGKIIDAKTNKPIEALVNLYDIDSKKEITHISSDNNGEFLLTLPTNQSYIATIDKKGYLFYTESFHLNSEKTDSTYEKIIYLTQLQINAAIQLNNVLFKTNSYELDSTSFVELNTLVKLLNENPNIKIEIQGHTDNVGTADDNLKLSDKRAHAVVDYLIQQNINPLKLQAKGFGETMPIDDNTTETGRRKNRRTELRVIQL